ncbi:MAG: PepSY domain-containing protein [Leptolyngbyaceae cyanobacterium SL_7_1]|nr:PepSY domain-containing protein [Leptolyngbyaceae cyanobacterium SL_7_1]
MSKAIPPAPDAVVESPSNRFYRTVWRWHFYAGLFVIPFLLMLAITGSIYLFKPQLDAVMYPNQLFVQPLAPLLPYTQQLQAVQRNYPQATTTKITPNVAIDRSTEVGLTTSDGHHLTVFVNPYTAAVLGDRDEDHNLQAIVRRIHGELMIGRMGDYLVELASCWALVLLISGLYLWLPRHKFTILGTLVPRVWSQSRRVFWRDIHAVPGFYGVLLVGFLILTGLPWSGFWGETFAQVWSHFPAQMWDEVPQSTGLTKTLNQHGDQVVPWAVEQLPMPRSTPTILVTTDHAHAGHAPEAGTTAPINLDSVIALAQESSVPAGFSVSFPEDEIGVYTVSAFPNDPTQEVTLHIDQYSGNVLADVRWEDYGLVPKAVEMGIAIHMGKFFGLGNQLLMLLACFIVVVLCISGAIMWWQRRPADRLGAPAMPAYGHAWKTPVAIVAVLGVLFPLVGLSLVAVLLVDYLVIARIPALQRWLN